MKRSGMKNGFSGMRMSFPGMRMKISGMRMSFTGMIMSFPGMMMTISLRKIRRRRRFLAFSYANMMVFLVKHAGGADFGVFLVRMKNPYCGMKMPFWRPGRNEKTGLKNEFYGNEN